MNLRETIVKPIGKGDKPVQKRSSPTKIKRFLTVTSPAKKFPDKRKSKESTALAQPKKVKFVKHELPSDPKNAIYCVKCNKVMP